MQQLVTFTKLTFSRSLKKYFINIATFYYVCSLNNRISPMKKVTVWIKAGKAFVNQDNIRAVKRHGRNTYISVVAGDDLVVDMKYDKFMELLPPGKF